MYRNVYLNQDLFLMQPISSSSQGHDQAAAADITNPKDNQQLNTASTRAVSVTHGHASTSAAIREQLTDEADMPSDTGLIARTIRETQALSVRSEPMSQSSIMAITAGRFNPLTARRPIGGNPVIEELQLSGGRHTYQPYFWISPLAHDQFAPFATRQRTELQSQVIDQLLMSESAAKENFQAHFEYRLVDYGFTSVDASGEREKNYGVFARKPVAKGTLLGIYSGIGYLLKSESWTKKLLGLRTDYLHQKFSEQMPDFMSYYRTVMADLRDKEQTQRTISKYSFGLAAKDPSNYIAVFPDNRRYTPMHFVNSANQPEDVNANFEYITVNSGSNNFPMLALRATKKIAAGQELLASYRVDSDGKSRRVFERSATVEKEYYNGKLDEYLDMINKLNRAEPNKPPISPYVAAPAVYISETIRETYRCKGAKNQHPSGIVTSGLRFC